MQPDNSVAPDDQSGIDPVDTDIASVPEPVSPSDQPGSWRYSSEADNSAGRPDFSELKPVSWTASEFVDHEKTAGWFLILAGLTAVATALVYLITTDIVPAAVIVLASGLLAVSAHRKPRTLEYLLNNNGIGIGPKLYDYDIFKSFSVLEEDALRSIMLMPLKRFMPPISLYYPPEQEDQIIDTLGSYLPQEDHSHDPIDRLMRKIRF